MQSQLRKQNQQLELQHKDAEIQLSMMGENIHERLHNFGNYSDEFLRILYKAKQTKLSALSDEEKWKFDPFSGTIHEGRVYGRGSNDCKALLTTQMMTFKILKRNNIN